MRLQDFEITMHVPRESMSIGCTSLGWHTNMDYKTCFLGYVEDFTPSLLYYTLVEGIIDLPIYLLT